MNFIRVLNSTVVLAVNADLEIARAGYFAPILDRFGTKTKASQQFDYKKYKALDPYDRCFDNAMETAIRYNLKYVEGIVLFKTEFGEFPLAHGWCIDGNEDVIDPTSHKNQGIVDCTYFGVPIKWSYSEWWKREVGYYGCLDGDRQRRVGVGMHYDHPDKWLDVVVTI